MEDTALVIALAMVVAMALPAWAAKVSMEIAEGDVHEYNVYQIYTGDLDGDTLSNVNSDPVRLIRMACLAATTL